MPSRCLVTGVAGFIGSHLAERLIVEGHEVIGVDCFTDYYPRPVKEQNLAELRRSDRFRFVEADLRTADLAPLLEGVETVFHQAAQAGVRASWGADFAVYTQNNVLATQRLLEAARGSGIKKFIYASSSSVYGDTPDLPMREESLPRPISPYGVTKLAGEHLCQLYHANFGVPTVSLRYFTVYGPRQRPDMAFHKFIRAILSGQPIAIYGDGEQTRDFTFISDAVEANILAMAYPGEGEIFNIGGGSRVSVNRVIELLEEITGREAVVEHQAAQPGDVRHTLADTTAARERLGFVPRVGLEEGLRAQVEWWRSVGHGQEAIPSYEP
ncbi:MAG TPA: NAD-dependent epimerase/dehydratase family protein [Anaerolineae bacterium]|nr:NAD-dependent epimerase/dehydratase family protein [Anaerolineae bacterium]